MAQMMRMNDHKQFNPERYRSELTNIIQRIKFSDQFDYSEFRKVLKKYTNKDGGFFSKDEILAGYEMLVEEGSIERDPDIEDKLRLKPTRTLSGVTVVTVLTKPYPCPGECIFCPNDVRMPKSYLSDEPGAQRAENNDFHPYLQTYNRLLALKNIGHNTDKIELIILGGTWSYYPEDYQIWFVKECFRAMNEFGVRDSRDEILSGNLFENADDTPRFKQDGRQRTYNEIISLVVKDSGKELIPDNEKATWEELFEQHLINEKSLSRCIGLVIETRPDHIDDTEVIKIRKLGATKVQIGIQSLNDDVLVANKRGHKRKEVEEAIKLLRMGGFKIHAHWMPNLYGSDEETDIEDYKKLWEPSISPDELKMYPTSIIENTELYELYKRGLYKPYSYDQLLHVLKNSMPITPRYCRLTRVVRDIPSTDIVAGNKLTNFRQIVEEELKKEGNPCQCIRCREIRGGIIKEEDLEMEVIIYKSSIGKEYFISYKTKSDDKICGFLRLAIPDKNLSEKNFFDELKNRSLIREVHVYGKVVGIGSKEEGRSQHFGLGKRMIEEAEKVSREAGYKGIAVISAIGTREYYRNLGFSDEGLYLTKSL